jgi:hypothetical protein
MMLLGMENEMRRHKVNGTLPKTKAKDNTREESFKRQRDIYTRGQAPNEESNSFFRLYFPTTLANFQGVKLQ